MKVWKDTEQKVFLNRDLNQKKSTQNLNVKDGPCNLKERKMSRSSLQVQESDATDLQIL